jgi:hypothetical protein
VETAPNRRTAASVPQVDRVAAGDIIPAEF